MFPEGTQDLSDKDVVTKLLEHSAARLHALIDTARDDDEEQERVARLAFDLLRCEAETAGNFEILAAAAADEAATVDPGGVAAQGEQGVTGLQWKTVWKRWKGRGESRTGARMSSESSGELTPYGELGTCGEDPPRMEVRRSVLGGLGLFALAAIRKGAPLTEYYGTRHHGRHTLGDVYPQTHVTQCEGVYVEGHREPELGKGMGQFANHSSDPNAEWEIHDDNNFVRFKALKTISKGEEIFHNYGEEYWESRNDTKSKKHS